MNLTRPCPRCYRKPNPYTLTVTSDNAIILGYECECGHIWSVCIDLSITVSEIGRPVHLSLEERVREMHRETLSEDENNHRAPINAALGLILSFGNNNPFWHTLYT